MHPSLPARRCGRIRAPPGFGSVVPPELLVVERGQRIEFRGPARRQDCREHPEYNAEHRYGQVRLWRVPATELPTDENAQVEWLYAWWARIDGWIEAEHGAPVAASG